MGKIGGLESDSDNVINMIKVRLHASRTHLSLPKMRRDNQMAAAATNEGGVASKRHSNVPSSSRYPHGPRYQIVIIRLTDTPQKVHWVGKAQVPVYSFQGVTLREQNLRFGVRGIRAVKEMRNGRCDNLFDLGGNEETRNTDKL
jgi:hypothetical protein